MTPIISIINLHEEVDAVVRYVEQGWTPIPQLKEVSILLRDRALYDARSWYDRYQLHSFIDKKLQDRERELTIPRELNIEGPIPPGFAEDFDAYSNALSNLSTFLFVYHSDIIDCEKIWNFEENAHLIEQEIYQLNSTLKLVTPINWEQIMQRENHESSGPLPLNGNIAFEGHIVPSIGMNLIQKLHSEELYYGHVDQGRSPSFMLISAIYSHFLSLAEYINTARIMREIDSLSAGTTDIVFEYQLSTDDPFLKVLWPERKPCTQEEFVTAYQEHIQFENLSDAEKERVKDENKKWLKEFTENMLSMIDSTPTESEKDNPIQKLKSVMNEQFVQRIFFENLVTSKSKRPKP